MSRIETTIKASLEPTSGINRGRQDGSVPQPSILYTAHKPPDSLQRIKEKRKCSFGNALIEKGENSTNLK